MKPKFDPKCARASRMLDLYDKDLDTALRRIYATYGRNLSAFFEAAYIVQKGQLLRVAPPPKAERH